MSNNPSNYEEQLKKLHHESRTGKNKPNIKTPSQYDLTYVDDVNEALLLSTPKHTRRLLYIIAAFVISIIVWASFASLDEVTKGSGKVIPSKQLQVVQNLEGGILKEIYVAEGEAVEPGQPLLLIDDTRFRSDLRESLQERANIQGSIARDKAALASVRINENGELKDWKKSVEISVAPLPLDADFIKDFPNIVQRKKAVLDERLNNLHSQLSVVARQISQREQERRELVSNISHLKESLKLVKEELAITSPLAEDGVVSKVELFRLKRQVNETQSELASTELLIPKVGYALQELISKRREIAHQFRTETQEQLNELQGQWEQMNEAQINLRDKVDRTTVVSPVKGTIQKINISTVGGVIQPGMDIVEIVPIEDQLLVEAKILPKDIGFLRPGLDAVVKFTAYDFAIYGGLKGKLEHISADTIQDEEGNSFYLVRIRTENNYLGDENRPLPIIPGMLAEVDVITGKKTVLDYLLKPILRAKQGAMTER